MTDITHLASIMGSGFWNRKILFTYLIMAAISWFALRPVVAQAQFSADSVPSPADKSEINTFWKNIDTHFGGRLRTAGRALQVDDDTIFAPVGTGTYWDGSLNFRLMNETFFTDSVYTDVAYELIGAGGDTVRKTKELKELFPNLPANIYWGGTPLNDDRRLMDLTDTVVDRDSYFLVQRLDRLYLARAP